MNDLYNNKNLFELELSFRVSIAGNYDYIIDYIKDNKLKVDKNKIKIKLFNHVKK